MLLSISFLISCLAIYWNWKYDYNDNTMEKTVRTEDIAFVTSSVGPGREIALSLADRGYHVVLGVSSESERKSFNYIYNKGLETILFDMKESSHVADVMYRVEDISRKLHRKLSTVVFVGDSDIYGIDSFQLLDIANIHDGYLKNMLGPVRIIQALGPYFNQNSNRLIFVTNGAYSLCARYHSPNKLKICGGSSVYQYALNNFISSFLSIHNNIISVSQEKGYEVDGTRSKNVSTHMSTIEYLLPYSDIKSANRKGTATTSKLKVKTPNKDKHSRLPKWNYAKNENVTMIYERVVRAVVHSVFSSHPEKSYSIGHVILRINTIPLASFYWGSGSFEYIVALKHANLLYKWFPVLFDIGFVDIDVIKSEI